MSLDPGLLFLSLITSGLGFVLFTYGKKQERYAGRSGCRVDGVSVFRAEPDCQSPRRRRYRGRDGERDQAGMVSRRGNHLGWILNSASARGELEKEIRRWHTRAETFCPQ